MKKLATILSLLLIFPAPTFAQDSQSSGIPADSPCAGLPRACAATAAELKAARELIAGYEAHIIAAADRIAVARKEIETLKNIGTLSAERAAELEAVIAAEREAKAALIKLKEEQTKRIAKLEKQLSRSRKFALIAGVAAGVAVLIAAVRR